MPYVSKIASKKGEKGTHAGKDREEEEGPRGHQEAGSRRPAMPDAGGPQLAILPTNHPADGLKLPVAFDEGLE
jgi:hypothetical protein